ncbi:hypothetical protein [Microscilla marina]|uniref:Uncharacterized protein n=1 Tax=Microscilla marina ATCC 23134 TaxID=313606 RepID=A1ZUB4_MICM2|nr:hypothetical protein [Microscilla marina]EAY26085.1 hypothetical protein M23134_06434 [Microscilla marina ATCC 23134]
MQISVTDEQGNHLVGAEIKGTLSVSCAGYQPLLKTVDVIYTLHQKTTVKLSLAKDTDMQRYFISNEIVQMFGFKDSSELPVDFCGLIIIKGAGKCKQAWLNQVDHLPNSVVISLYKIITEQGLRLEVAMEFLKNLVDTLGVNHYQFIVIDVEEYHFSYDNWQFGKTVEKVFVQGGQCTVGLNIL